MTIAAGDKIPAATLFKMTGEGPAAVTTDEIFGAKKVVMFGVPGAFTPTCSAKHLPGFIEKASGLKAKGVDDVVCVSVNDVFVMDAWSKDQGAGGAVLLVADGSADFTKAAGLELDLTARGLGLRCQRFALVAENSVVKSLEIDDAGAFEKTSAEAVMNWL